MHIQDFKTRQAQENVAIGNKQGNVYIIPDNLEENYHRENMKKNLLEFVVMQNKAKISL